jgi:lactoylglutathione lyase
MKYGFVTVSVKNMEESANFYKEILGLKEARRFSPQPGIDIMFLKDEGNNAIELIAHQGDEDVSGRVPVSIGFEVESLDATMAMLKEKNVAIVSGPMGVPGGVRFIFINDPNGVGIEFIEGFKL